MPVMTSSNGLLQLPKKVFATAIAIFEAAPLKCHSVPRAGALACLMPF